VRRELLIVLKPEKRPFLARTLQITVSVACVAVLSGCTPLDKVSARLDGDTIVFAVCESATVNHIRVDARSVDHSEPIETVWEARSPRPVVFAIGEEITFGVVPEGFEELTRPKAIDLASYNYYFAVVNREYDYPPSEALGGLFQGSALSADYWINENGEKSDEACADD